MKIKFGSKIIGGYRLNKSFFLQVYDKDTNINKSWVIQFTKYLKDDLITYSHGYKLYNFGFIRFGFSINEI